MRMAAEVEPGRVLEAAALHHQRVAVPTADGIAHEAGVGIGGQRAPVHEDLAVAQVLVEDDDEQRRLDDLGPPAGAQRDARSLRQALEGAGIVLAQVLHALLVELSGPRLHFRRLQIRDQVAAVGAGIGAPQAGQIRFAVGRLWRGRAQVGLAVRGTRDAPGRLLDPLRLQRRRESTDHQEDREAGLHRFPHFAPHLNTSRRPIRWPFRRGWCLNESRPGTSIGRTQAGGRR